MTRMDEQRHRRLDNDGDQVYDLADTGTVNIPPIAVHGGPYWGIVGAPLTFDGSQSVDPDGTLTSRVLCLDVRRRQHGYGEKPTHTYASADTFVVTLTVTDSNDVTDVATTSAEIVVAGSAPPVNQFIGMIDKSAGAMTEPDCRDCHVAPPVPVRHHNLYA